MALSALDKIRLGRQVNSLIQDSQAATGFRKISVGRQITALLIRLGYGQPAEQTGYASSPELQTGAVKPTATVSTDKPEIVASFLNGDFVHQESGDFAKTLTDLERYLDVFLTMEDVVAGAMDWLRANYSEAA